MEKLKPSIRIYRADKSIPLPERKTVGSAGWDVYASEETLLMPGIVTLVPTGLIIETPPGYHFRVFYSQWLCRAQQCQPGEQRRNYRCGLLRSR
jgi:dUTPase